MHATATTHAHHRAAHAGLGPEARGKVAVACFLITEVAFFSTLIVAYLFYHRHPGPGPTAADSLDLMLPTLGTICLVTSSLTIALAGRAAARADTQGTVRWLVATVLLAAGFLVVTGVEWYGLLSRGVTIASNLFGSTYFTLIGFHAGHVTLGAIVMLLFVAMLRRGTLGAKAFPSIELVGWYWHFVDGVWIVILVVVYLLARQ